MRIFTVMNCYFTRTIRFIGLHGVVDSLLTCFTHSLCVGLLLVSKLSTLINEKFGLFFAGAKSLFKRKVWLNWICCFWLLRIISVKLAQDLAKLYCWSSICERHYSALPETMNLKSHWIIAYVKMRLYWSRKSALLQPIFH